MIEKKQNEIINNIYKTKEVKRLIILKNKLNKNKKYNDLLKKAEIENPDLIKIRKELFKIDDFKEYMSLYTELKLKFLKINNMITSLIK